MSKSSETLKKRYGENYFVELGRKGGLATSKKYKLIPYGMSKYALVYRSTGKIRAIF